MGGRILLLILGLMFVSFAQGPYLLVIDGSGSMDDFMPLSDEETKMEAAKTAAKGFVDKTGGEIGVVVFEDCDTGGDIQSGDIRLVQDFTANKAVLRSKIGDLEPRWDTPIADALQESKAYLESTRGYGTIILITDGEETCGGEPVEIAGEIYEENVGTVHVVGFLIGGETEKIAKAIAVAGGGKYYSANSTVELERALTDIGSPGLLDMCCPGGILAILIPLGFVIRVKQKN